MAQITLKINIDEYVKKYLKMLIIMRGLPGSGKSYMAEQFQKNTQYDCGIYSTDAFFMRNAEKVYKFNGKAIGIAHKWNQNRVATAMNTAGGQSIIIVDNTNTTWKEIEPYAQMGKEHGYFIMVAEPDTDWAMNVEECVKRNQHGVPLESIQRMKARWEPLDAIGEKLRGLVNTET